MEIKENVKTVKVSMKCDKCKIGYMERCDNIVLTSCPPKYQHKCNHCAHVENFTVEYPYLDIEKIKDDNFEDDYKPDLNNAVKAIIRCLSECVEDLKDLYSYKDFY